MLNASEKESTKCWPASLIISICISACRWSCGHGTNSTYVLALRGGLVEGGRGGGGGGYRVARGAISPRSKLYRWVSQQAANAQSKRSGPPTSASICATSPHPPFPPNLLLHNN